MVTDDLGLVAVADRLYALDPDEFTGAREHEAAEARSAGQPDVARVIKTWRRPTRSAWLVNVLSREYTDQLQELFELGAALRVAQEDRDGEQLRTLSGQRRRLVDELAQQARVLADNAGRPVSESVAREVEATLQAAVADPAAADAVRTSRLVTALSSNGFDPVDLAGAVVLATAARSAKPPRSGRRANGSRTVTSDHGGGARVRIDKAREAARDAEAGRAEAERALGDAEQAVSSHTARVAELRTRVGELEAALDQARSEADAAAGDLSAARRARSVADRELQAARRRGATADTKLKRLESG